LFFHFSNASVLYIGVNFFPKSYGCLLYIAACCIGSSSAGTTEALRYTLLHCTADPVQPAPPEDELILAPDSGCCRCRNEIRTILWSERTIQHGRRAAC
jgi:hypothetical protein